MCNRANVRSPSTLELLDNYVKDAQNSIGIVSHALPPSTSGQAIMLGRLLSAFPADRFCLISREPADVGGPWRRRKLPGLLRLPAPTTAPWWVANHAINALWGIHRRAAQIEAIARSDGLGLLVACSGDLFDLPASYWAAQRLRIPFAAYVFDDYRFQWSGANRAIAALLEPRILRGATRVIVPNESLKGEYRRRYAIDSVVVHNPCIMPSAADHDSAPVRRGKAIVYTGSIYHAHYDSFRRLIAAIERTGRPDLKLVVYSPQPEAELARNGISGALVEYHPAVHEAEARRVACGADVLFLPLAFDSEIGEVVRTSAPGKLGDYLASGRPILAHAPRGSFLCDFLAQRGCGVVVDERDPALLSAALTSLLADEALSRRIGDAGRKIAAEEFALAPMAERFRAVLAECGVALP